jgi:SAM-dependent methyltransferase
VRPIRSRRTADEQSRAVFERIYGDDHWRGGSGEGSTVDATAPYRRLVEHLLRARDIRSVVDVGCGDWQSSHLIDWQGANYLGLDLVPAVIRANTERFATPTIGFELRDAAREPLPRADLLLCKDVLQHWPVATIRHFVRRQRWRYRYVLLTNDVASVHSPESQQNADIPIGHWRTLDLERRPFRVRPDATFDFVVRNEWTKRMMLLVHPLYRLSARCMPRTALTIARRYAA